MPQAAENVVHLRFLANKKKLHFLFISRLRSFATLGSNKKPMVAIGEFVCTDSNGIQNPRNRQYTNLRLGGIILDSISKKYGSSPFLLSRAVLKVLPQGPVVPLAVSCAYF